MKSGVLKILALFAYCGGPLFVGELLEARVGTNAAFLITFLPIGLMLLGALFMDDDIHNRWSSAMVRAGRWGLFVALGMHLYALWCFARGERVPDQALHYFGIVAGMALTVGYWRASRRWSSATDDSPGMGDPSSPKPIEPS